MDCLPGSSEVGEDTRVGEGGCGEREDQSPKSSAPPPQSFPMPAGGGLVTLVLTSASFQSPGMQKDSSRSLPHSSKIRSSEEGDRVCKGSMWRPGKHATPQPSSPVHPDVSPLGLPGPPAPWCVLSRSLCWPLPPPAHRPPLSPAGRITSGRAWFAGS